MSCFKGLVAFFKSAAFGATLGVVILAPAFGTCAAAFGAAAFGAGAFEDEVDSGAAGLGDGDGIGDGSRKLKNPLDLAGCFTAVGVDTGDSFVGNFALGEAAEEGFGGDFEKNGPDELGFDLSLEVVLCTVDLGGVTGLDIAGFPAVGLGAIGFESSCILGVLRGAALGATAGETAASNVFFFSADAVSGLGACEGFGGATGATEVAAGAATGASETPDFGFGPNRDSCASAKDSRSGRFERMSPPAPTASRIPLRPPIPLEFPASRSSTYPVVTL